MFDAGGPTPIDTATLEAVVLGGNLFDGAAGAFNGAIDRFRAFTFVGAFDPSFLLSAPAAVNFAAWIAGFPVGGLTGFNDDFDLDGLGNGLENFLGTDPGAWNAGLTELASDGSSATFQHPRNATPASDVSGSYEWSLDLEHWTAPGTVGDTTVTITATPDDPVVGTTTVTATASGTIPTRLFVRLQTTQTM